ncbi:hypothetical protein AB0I27_23065 [Streptomyces sp. NPDC050597]|uniref:hypothetical protein n=1 Tax=Streptomyces sp. NPDC050597 TaxID=3157212 RepID=UPI0034368AE8
MIPIRIPAPDAVRRFSATQTSQPVRDAARQADMAELHLARTCSPLSVEDVGDRETLLAEWHRADKVLSATALRPVQATGVLS